MTVAVLDHSIRSVSLYTYEGAPEEVEQFIESQGHHVSQCSYMTNVNYITDCRCQ